MTFFSSVFRSSKVMLTVFSAGLPKRMIPSIPRRIELILAKGPQALHPGLLS